MPQKIKFDISTSAIIKVLIAVLLVAFFYTIREIAVLFFIVLIIVAAFSPLVDKISKYIPRSLGVVLLYLIFLGILGAIGYLLIPPAITQLSHLAIDLPAITLRAGPIFDLLQRLNINYQEAIVNLSSQLGNITSQIYTTTVSFISALVAAFTILIISFYMLLEHNATKDFISNIIPVDQRERVISILKKIGVKMGAWLRGQFVLMLIVGILDAIVLFSLGIPYALLLALWGGLTEIIPYIGPWLGLIPAVFIALSISPLTALIVVIAYLIIQQLEAQFIVPKVMGKAIGLSPVVIILALLIGAKLMGILGVIIAVPVVAAISVIFSEWTDFRKILSQSN